MTEYLTTIGLEIHAELNRPPAATQPAVNVAKPE